MEVEEFLKEAAVMKEIKHPNLVQLLGMLRARSLGGGVLYSQMNFHFLSYFCRCIRVCRLNS